MNFFVIDNGSYQFRGGLYKSKTPAYQFRNLVSKSRNKQISVGNDINDTCDGFVKSPFEENLVINWDVQESVLDYFLEKNKASSFSGKGVVFNEVLFNPSFCRKTLMEILFETYSADKAMLYVDFLASQYANVISSTHNNGIAISLGHKGTHLVPIWNNKPIYPASRRINLGGMNIVSSMTQLLAIKYPCFEQYINYNFSETLVHEHGKICLSQSEELSKWANQQYLDANSIKVPLNYFKYTLEDTRAALAKRQQRSDRLRNIRKNKSVQQLESLIEKKAKIVEILNLAENHSYSSKVIQEKCKELDLISEQDHIRDHLEEIKMKIDSIESKLGHSQLAEMDIDEKTEELVNNFIDESTMDQPDPFDQNTTWDMVNKFKNGQSGRIKRAYTQLTKNFLPSAVQAQIIANETEQSVISEEKLSKRKAAAKEIEESCGEDVARWLQNIRYRLIKVNKQRTQRQNKTELAVEMGLRSNVDASLNESDLEGSSKVGVGTGKMMTERRRMQLEKIRAMTSELNSFPENQKESKTTKKRPTATDALRKDKNGVKDKKNAKVDSKVDFEPIEIEEIVQPYDPFTKLLDEETNPFLEDDDPKSRTVNDPCKNMTKEKENFRSAFQILEDDANGNVSENERDQIQIFTSLVEMYDPELTKDPTDNECLTNTDDYYVIRMDTQALRSTEILFNPSLIGHTFCGVTECFEWVLKNSSAELDHANGESPQEFIPEYIFLTGGVANTPGIDTRIKSDILQYLPFDTFVENIKLPVVKALNPSLDAWHGAASFTQKLVSQSKVDDYFLSREDYFESGLKQLKANEISNPYSLITG